MNSAMAGLGALTKQSGQPTGRSPESMSQTMALAKQMSDMQLADVLAGKSMNIPQYVAMTEAMGRKQLRTAMQGMTAMTSAKQPTEREKLLSEMMPRQPQQTMMSVPSQGGQPAAGIDTLPADNMQGLADGGIIAFADRGQVQSPRKSFWDTVDPAKYQTEPGYKAFVDESGETDKTYKNYLELGNTPPLTERQLADARFENSYNIEKDWRNSPEGKKADIQAQQMGEPSTTLPSKVKTQSWTEMIGGDQKEGTRIAERTSGLNPGDYARMQAAQANPIGPKTPAATASLSGRNEGTLLPKTPAYSSEPVDDKQYQDSIAIPPKAVSSWWDTHMADIRKQNEAAAAARGQPITPSVSPKRISEAEAAQAEMLRAEAASPGVAPPNSPAAAPKLDMPPKAGSGTGGGGTGGGGGGPGGGGPGGYGGGKLPQTNLSKFATEQAELLRPKERNKDYYAALEADSATNAKQIESGKSQAQGEFLMQLGASLMSTPNIGIALSKGVQAGLPGLAASRKEINALTKDQRDYKFNIAKAKEARDQGDELLSLNYLKLADQIEFHAGTIGVGMARASGGGGSDKLKQQLNIAATKLTNEQWKNFVKTQGIRGSKLTAADEADYFKKHFPSNLSMMSGQVPDVDDDSDVFERPGGPILARPQK